MKIFSVCSTLAINLFFLKYMYLYLIMKNTKLKKSRLGLHSWYQKKHVSVLSSKWSHPCACPLGVSQASLLEHLPPKDFDMTQLLLRNQQGKFKMAEGCFIPISQQHTSNSKALWDFGSYGNSNRDSLLFEKEVPAAQVRDKKQLCLQRVPCPQKKDDISRKHPLKIFLDLNFILSSVISGSLTNRTLMTFSTGEVVVVWPQLEEHQGQHPMPPLSSHCSFHW